jgi:deazaflavin-dependent oxidoreductase (nitroreductase family)
MNEQTWQAIARDWLADITTTGRKSGKQHTVEVLLRQIDGQLYLSNQPDAKRDWAANLMANPEFTYHLKQSVKVALKAKATPIHSEATRREVYANVLKREGRLGQVEARVQRSNLFKIELLDE